MSKLYFRHGAMGSAKTLNLLAVRHNYIQQGKKVITIKPRVDDRWGEHEKILSRAGLYCKADLLLDEVGEIKILESIGPDVDCVLVDEAQFLSTRAVEILREVATCMDIPVIAYGLRTDFRARLFPGSQRLLELSDSIEEVKTTCQFCKRKAIFNLRHDKDGNAIVEGPQILVGAEELYSPVCHECYLNRTPGFN